MSSGKKSSVHMQAGFIAGMTSTVALYPLDLIKVRFQVSCHLPTTLLSFLSLPL
jgi:hypothetical protein